MAYLRAHLFGPLEARIDEDIQPIHFPTQKIKWMFGYLLLNRNMRHSREQLSTLWWGDREAPKARHCLNTALWRLRQALKPAPTGQVSFLFIDGDEVSFNINSDYWLDVDEFERQCARARQSEGQDDKTEGQSLQRATALYRADLLADCYEEWCLAERQRLQQLYLFALSRLAAFHTRRNEFTESIACCRQILACDSLREEVHRELIRLYFSAARPLDAMRQFQACAAILKRELGVEPMAETVALVRSLPTQDGWSAPMGTPHGTQRPMPHGATASQDLQDIFAHLTSAAESVTMASLQIEQALNQAEQLLTRLDD